MFLFPPSPCKEDTSEWTWPRIFIFFLLWWTFYWALLRFLNKEPDYCCRLITFLHGIIVVYFTLKDIIISQQEFDFCCKTPLTPHQLYFLSITISYFLYDLIWIYLYGTESVTVHLHHVFSIFLLFKIITTDTGGPGISYGLFGLEFTNPYLQTRWFLRTHGYHNNLLYKVVELWFITAFLIIRVFAGTTLLYFVEIHPNMDITLKIAFIGIYIVSWLLIAQIIQYCRKKYIYIPSRILSGSAISIFPYPRRRPPIPPPPPENDDVQT